MRQFLKDHPEKLHSRNERLADMRNQLEKLEKEKADLMLKRDQLRDIADSVAQETDESYSKEINDILKSDYNSRIKKLQDLAQNILKSANYEKNEVYHHKSATPKDKQESVQTLENMKSRLTYILELVIKVINLIALKYN